MRAVSLVLSAFVFAAGPAGADGWNIRDGTMTTRVEGCGGGMAYCLTFGCRDLEPPMWQLFIKNAELPVMFDVEVRVNGQVVGAIEFTQGWTYEDWTSTVMPAHREIVAALGAAGTLELRPDTDGDPRWPAPVIGIPLDGASEAIAYALARCPLP